MLNNYLILQMCRNQHNVIFENPLNCRAFIECRDNFRLDRECTSGQLFEITSKECLSDFVVNCGNRPIISGSDSDFTIISTVSFI